jgi:hypothetical protein
VTTVTDGFDLPFGENPGAPSRLMRAVLRESNDMRPRCAICTGDLLHGARLAKLDTVAPDDGFFVDGDLLCWWCSVEFNREQDDSSPYQWGRC